MKIECSFSLLLRLLLWVAALALVLGVALGQQRDDSEHYGGLSVVNTGEEVLHADARH
ncbi:hypothetical protein [Prauserella cavernicola]|uniref:Uncharacterized protein n=1 Tax=Prauserella cavernicola TaxID=2800127 RepID=A0A934QSH6_9PSEU|nr:hypothetical protein [Prauserella cavernicola]MBK1785507.1 hypothetical protein [Prauserella cavernicola]